MTTDRESPLSIIPSIESARGMLNLSRIAGWGSKLGRQMGGSLSALLVCLHPSQIPFDWRFTDFG
jgi:citrate lyase beta subunit